MLYSLVGIYFILINARACLLMHADKKKARRGAWRIPEATLLGIAAAGGSIGAICGMLLFRHKTRHIKFVLGLPAILIGQTALLFWIFRFF